jgi:outer membrane protein assembly factor BamE (lipoprotein component of BamABCDE complex)
MGLRRSSAFAGIAGSVALAALAAGCSPTISNHGYTPLPEELAELQVGLDTRASVQSKIGRPAGTGIFTDNGWYYVSNRVEHLTYHAPEVVDRRVVELIFDQNETLASVTEYGLEDGRVIDLETKTTPTYGRQLTILEQAFGNICGITQDSIDEF